MKYLIANSSLLEAVRGARARPRVRERAFAERHHRPQLRQLQVLVQVTVICQYGLLNINHH